MHIMKILANNELRSEDDLPATVNPKMLSCVLKRLNHGQGAGAIGTEIAACGCRRQSVLQKDGAFLPT